MEFIQRNPLAYLDFSNVNFNKGKLVHSTVILENLDHSEFEFIDGRECIIILLGSSGISSRGYSFKGANLESAKILHDCFYYYPEKFNFAGTNFKNCWLTENVLETALLAADLKNTTIVAFSQRNGSCEPLSPEKWHYSPRQLAMSNNADQITNLAVTGREELQALHQKFLKDNLVFSDYVSSTQGLFQAFLNYRTACNIEKSGWKFHINISKENYSALFSENGKPAEQLFAIFQKYGISEFKYRRDNDMACKQITAYVYRDPWSGKYDLPIEKYIELIKEVEQFLSENNFKPAAMQSCDAEIIGAHFCSLRNDKNSEGDYIPTESAQSYNLSGSPNPFYAYIKIRQEFGLSSQTDERPHDSSLQTRTSKK